MKIQLDQNGNSTESSSQTSRATGILLTRKGRELTIDIGNRVTPHAVFAALTHMRSMAYQITITSHKASLASFMPIGTSINASDACFFLGKLLIQLVENRQELFTTKDLRILTQQQVSGLPMRLHSLCNLNMHRMETAAALSMVEEDAMADISFVMPSSEMSFSDCGYKARKLPLKLAWPTEEPYVPLSFSQLLTSPYASWYNSLCHIALCVRRPLIQQCQMKLTLTRRASHDKEAPQHISENQLHDLEHNVPRAQWYEVTRILYPLASAKEKPFNFRLLICSLIEELDEVIL